MKKSFFLGVGIAHQTMSDVLSQLELAVTEKRLFRIYTPNPEILLKARASAVFQAILQRAECLIPDGAGLLFFSSLSQRITGVDLCEKIVERSCVAPLRIFLLGAAPGVAQTALSVWKERYPAAQIVGSFADCSAQESDVDAISQRISASGANVVMVAFGAPAQESWIDSYYQQCPEVSVWLGIGGTFDFVAGVYGRAPSWMRLLRIEWLYRLLQQPSRLGRIWNAVVVFSFCIVLERIMQVFKKPS